MAIKLNDLMYANSTSPYMDAYNRMKKSLQAQRKTDVANINKNRDADIAKSNAGYDQTARQNYINYMQAQKALPSQLNALGIRGGASESSALRLGTNYGTNVANNESARQTALAELRNAYAKQVADYDSDLNSRLATAEATARQNQIAWEKEQIEKDLERFSGVIEGLYKKRSSYEKLIEQLKKSKDPNKKYKIMLARRAMNQLSSGGSGGGGGGGGRTYGGYGGGGYYGGGDNSDNNNNGGNGGNGDYAIQEAQRRGQSMTDYYKRMMNKQAGQRGMNRTQQNSRWK